MSEPAATPTPRPARHAGILLHPTSLPGRFGVGDLGPAAEAFLDWAAAAGQSVWQVLPLGPTGEGHSPYTALSAFAGNPLLISPERLVEDGLLDAADLADAPASFGRIAFAHVGRWKEGLLRRAWERFRRQGSRELREEMRRFAADPRHGWLHDWELFSALRARFAGKAWTEWPAELARREPAALAAADRELVAEAGYHRFVQWVFFRQWERLHAAAKSRGIRILGDLPIYVAHDSAEVWVHPRLFDLDEAGQPRVVAGVPPDYFSATGQRWGNPLYRWDRLAAEGFAWWIDRLRGNLELADLVRIDHFRAFSAYWEVPADAPTALEGRWVDGPGLPFFTALAAALGTPLGELPIVAEDLGIITEDVVRLREDAGLPGMRVLQFAFGEPHSSHLPHMYERHTVVYTGTHDNDTAVGWYRSLSGEEQSRVRAYVGGHGESVHWDLIRAAYTSIGELAVVPLQDVLGLGSEARMNTPGEPEDNWGWRVDPRQVRGEEVPRLRYLAQVTGRLPEAAVAAE